MLNKAPVSFIAGSLGLWIVSIDVFNTACELIFNAIRESTNLAKWSIMYKLCLNQ